MHGIVLKRMSAVLKIAPHFPEKYEVDWWIRMAWYRNIYLSQTEISEEYWLPAAKEDISCHRKKKRIRINEIINRWIFRRNKGGTQSLCDGHHTMSGDLKQTAGWRLMTFPFAPQTHFYGTSSSVLSLLFPWTDGHKNFCISFGVPAYILNVTVSTSGMRTNWGGREYETVLSFSAKNSIRRSKIFSQTQN